MGPRPPAKAPQLVQGPHEVVSISAEELVIANERGSHDLDDLLDRAFGVDGLGIICVTGSQEFQSRVQQIREELLPLALDLDRLPESAKEAISERGTVNINNYSKGIDGHRSGFYFHPTTDTPGDNLPPNVEQDPNFYTPNLWPDDLLPELKVRGREAASFLVDIGQQFACAVDRRCCATFEGYKANTLETLFQKPKFCNHKCRLICYHDYETDEQRMQQKGMWAPPHKDTGLLTALVPGVFLSSETGARLAACPDPEVGLYIKNRKGAIAQISVPAGTGECIFFQIGEALQIVSGGLYQATEHCVRGPPKAQAGYIRASLAVFFQPHAHEDLPLPDGVSAQDVSAKTTDGLFRMFLLYQPKDTTGINFAKFCSREGF